MSAADTWIDNEPDVAVANQFANAGYDVWLGNNRGNKYSATNNHMTPSSDPKHFFDYSFQDLGEYDLKTQIEQVLSVTGKMQLTYMGHSQGTSQMYYALATDQEWFKSRVNLFIAAAPIVRFKHIETKAKLGITLMYPLEAIFDGADVWSIMGKEINSEFDNWKKTSLNGAFVEWFLNAVGGSSEYENAKWSDIAGSWGPARASTKELFHYGQMIKSDTFQMYDYGSDNMSMYGQAAVPQLSLAGIDLPIAMFVGMEDPLANYQDCEWVRDQLDNVVHYQEIDNFDHSSFTDGQDMSYMTQVLAIAA